MDVVNDLVEEVFCLNFETKLFAQYVNYGVLERWIPGFSDRITEECHVIRYDFVKKYVGSKSVLDIACGTGKGSSMMAEAGAAKVLGADIDPDAVRYARHRYKQSNLSYTVADATQFVSDQKFDVIVSFETIEHLNDVASFLKNINANLKPGGVFLVSTPLSSKDIDTQPHNIYHVQEWGFRKFQEVVAEFLVVEKSFLQLFPEQPTGRLTIYIDRLLNRQAKPAYTTKIYEADEVEKAGKLLKLGKSVKGYQILQCVKK